MGFLSKMRRAAAGRHPLFARLVREFTMSSLSPKPVIAHTVRTWRVHPGMTFALVEDIEADLWIVESCPAGTHFWTVAQAAELPQGARTRSALREAVREGRRLEAARQREMAQVSRPGDRSARPQAMPRSLTASRRKPEADSVRLHGRKIQSIRPATLSETSLKA
jgi:hypothetical protein